MSKLLSQVWGSIPEIDDVECSPPGFDGVGVTGMDTSVLDRVEFWLSGFKEAGNDE